MKTAMTVTMTGRPEGRAGAKDDAAEDVAAEIVGAEKMRQRRVALRACRSWLR